MATEFNLYNEGIKKCSRLLSGADTDTRGIPEAIEQVAVIIKFEKQFVE